jgi:hypothetical protein
MSEQYTKLAQRIVYSSLWGEDSDTCKVWVTLLALKDSDGIVRQNITGIARLANLPIQKVQEAFEKFKNPDPLSTSQKEEGRRIIPHEGGWFVVNHSDYRELGWSDEKKRYEADKKARYRKRREERAAAGATAPPPHEEKPLLTPEPAPLPPPAEKGNKPPPPPKFTPPTREELNLAAAKIGLPDLQVDKFVNFYASKGWMVGKNKMKSWQHALANWKIGWQEDGGVAKPTPEEEKNKPWWTPPAG